MIDKYFNTELRGQIEKLEEEKTHSEASEHHLNFVTRKYINMWHRFRNTIALIIISTAIIIALIFLLLLRSKLMKIAKKKEWTW